PQEIFSHYAYFSSYSASWLEHAQHYVQMAMERFKLTSSSQVIELASNDGYLLQFFKELGIPILGIEPAKNIAEIAIAKGIPTLTHFFGRGIAETLKESADLLIGNNVLAHVPDLNDFIAAMKVTLKPHGTITMEFPHVMNLIEENQFDTIYHEHFSYFSLQTIKVIFAHHGLEIFDVDLLATHGGSLRIYAKHKNGSSQTHSPSIQDLLAKERARGLHQLTTYQNFSQRADKVKNELLAFLTQAEREKKRVVAYGAPAKGNTLLNFCQLSPKSLPFTVDLNVFKQDKYLPGTHIPIFSPDKILETKPDYLLILPWNLKNEIIKERAYIRQWGGKFVIPIPRLEVIK
ncbi:MAG TPA: class I SAM-dependent methyltransferase, partial [Waddliaceae bacterium]